jgi:carboxypeptidase C (cathepsin A)
MYLNGLMLVSAILNFQTARFFPGNDLPYILFLPTYTATAYYHNRLPARLMNDLDETLKEVEAFAEGEYATALMKGDALSKEDTDAIVSKLASYTGLSPEYVRQTNLRINIMRFTKQLLRDERKVVGRIDSRFTGVDRDAAGETWENDPSINAIIGPYTATLNDYVRGELGFESDLPYEILTSRVRPWSYKEHENTYVNVGETLREAITVNPYLKVFVANGYYDLATPYFATEYTFDHLQLEPAHRANIEMANYPAGHMMYVEMGSLRKMKDDLSQWLDKSWGN